MLAKGDQAYPRYIRRSFMRKSKAVNIMQMPPNVRGNCDNLICFRQKQAEDVELLVKSQGPEFGIAGKLLPGQYVANIEDRIQRGVSWILANGRFSRISL